MKLVGEGFSRNGHLSLKGVAKAVHDDNRPTSFVERVDLYDRKSKLALIKHLIDDLTWSMDEARDKVNALVIKVEEGLLAAEELPDDDDTKKSQGTILVDLAEDAELWHTPEGECFATIEVGAHRETWGLRTKAFRDWLSFLFFRQEGKSPGGQAVADALAVLSGKALFEGSEYVVYARVAEVDGVIYLDLANDGWEAVEVAASGWRVTDTYPVRFRRPRGMLPLPYPVSGDNIGALRILLNLASDDDWALFLGCLVQALRGRGPYPVLTICGEHGSAKSTASLVFRRLIDPNKSDLRSPPRDERDLRIQATNGWIVGYDNLSSLTEWLSNALCRLSTGGGMGTRALYTDDEEKIFDGQRPSVLNGIEDVATRPDLVDRAVILQLLAIPEEERVTEVEFWGSFEAAHASILGGLLDAVVSGLRRASEVHLNRLPRMADFALWVTAAEPGLGLKPGAFMKAYRVNRASANDVAIDAQDIGPSIIKLMEEVSTWTGTATELLAKLTEITDENVTKAKSWPTRPNILSNKLRVLAPNLRAAGIDIAHGEGQDRRKIIITRPGADPGGDESGA